MRTRYPQGCALRLDLDLYAGGKLDTHQGLDGLLRGVQNVDQTLVGAGLELLAAILVLVYSAKDRNDLLLRGERNGTGNGAAVSLCNLHYLLRCGIDEGVVKAFQTHSDLFFCCHGFASFTKFAWGQHVAHRAGRFFSPLTKTGKYLPHR